MFRTRILALMIVCFGFSQSSSMLISLLNHGKNITSILIDTEETEQMGKMEFESDETIDDFIFDFRFRVLNKLKSLYPGEQRPLSSFLLNSPETPPPNVV